MSALTTQEATMHARQPGRRASPPSEFRTYLYDQHWLAGRRIRSQADPVAPMSLHPASRPSEFTEAMETFLEQALVDARLEREHRTGLVRWRRVESAMRSVALDRPEEVEALRYYMVPSGRRSSSVVARAQSSSVSGDTLRRMADRAVSLVWDEMGGLW